MPQYQCWVEHGVIVEAESQVEAEEVAAAKFIAALSSIVDRSEWVWAEELSDALGT